MTRSPVRKSAFVVASICVALLAGGCARQPPENASVAVAEASPYKPTATFQEVMDSIVDPAAEFIWEAVSTEVDNKGIHERMPHSEAEWHQMRQHAIVLVEAANLIAVPGRRVASGATTVEDVAPLEVDKIQRRLDAQHDQLVGFANALRDIDMKLVADVDRKDTTAIKEHGSTLDDVCEACHTVFWYPDQAAPAQASK